MLRSLVGSEMCIRDSTWCARRCRLSAGFISPHLVYQVCCTWYEYAPTCVLVVFAALLPCARSATMSVWAFDTATLRYVLTCSWVRAFCNTSLWSLDTVNLRYALSCSLVRPFCHDDFVGLFYGRNACFQIPPRECNFATLDPSEKCERTARASDQYGSMH